MERGRVGAEAVSCRQLALAALTAGLSPAAVFAGKTWWVWVLAGSGIAAVSAALVRRRVCSAPQLRFVRVLYALWAVVLSARVLDGTAARLEQTSGGSPRFWLLAIVALPLVLIGWGKTAAFFRMAEILWLALAVTLALIFLPAVGKIQWRGWTVHWGDWRTGLLAAAEIIAPTVFTIPYIYNAQRGTDGGEIRWLMALGGIAAAMSLLTAGMLGVGSAQIPQAFFAAAGLTGGSARSEGLLSVMWLLPDLICVSLLCRSWGGRRWPALAAALSVALTMAGVQKYFTPGICAAGTLTLLLLSVVCTGKGGNFVVRK